MIKVKIMYFIMILIVVLAIFAGVCSLLDINYSHEKLSSRIIGLYIIFEILRYWHNKENPNEEL